LGFGSVVPQEEVIGAHIGIAVAMAAEGYGTQG